jgi:hypothetical protein
VSIKPHVNSHPSPFFHDSESPSPFLIDGTVDWVTAHRVLLRVRHLHLHLHKVANLASAKPNGNDPHKSRYFSHGELSRLERKISQVEMILLSNFASFFTRNVPEQPQPPPSSETDSSKMDVSTTNEGADPIQQRLDAFRDIQPIMAELHADAIDWKDAPNRASHVGAFIDYVTRWREEDIEEDPTFMEPNQILQSYFRNIITRLTTPKVIPVRGDGNCFFRAVVKFLWPTVSQFYEELLSHRLRALINPRKEKPSGAADGDATANAASAESEPVKASEKASEDKMQDDPPAAASAPLAEDEAVPAQPKLDLSSSDPYKGFIIPDVNDPSTMANPGVWADHVQVQKAADLFRRPIWLIRYDDINLKFDKSVGGFVPGPDYRIGAHQDASPITLYFTPETHYEVVAMDPTVIETSRNFTLIEAINHLKRGPTQAILKSGASEPLDKQLVYECAEDMCELAFALEKLAESVEEEFALQASAQDLTLRNEFRHQLTGDADRARNSIVALKQLVDAVRKDHFARPLRQDTARPEGILLDGVLAAISEDGIKISKEKRVEPGSGPLSSIFNRIHYCRSNLSMMNSVDAMRANKRAEERRLQDLLRRQPSRGLLSALAEADEDEIGETKLDMQSAAQALELLADQTSAHPKPNALGSIMGPPRATVVLPNIQTNVGATYKTPAGTISHSAPAFLHPTATSRSFPLGGIPAPQHSQTASNFAGEPMRPQLQYQQGGSLYEPPSKRQKLDLETESEPQKGFFRKMSDNIAGVLGGTLQNTVAGVLGGFTGSSNQVPRVHKGSTAGGGLESSNLECEEKWSQTFFGATKWIIRESTMSGESFSSLIKAAFASTHIQELVFERCTITDKCKPHLIDCNNLSPHVAVRFEDCTLQVNKSMTGVMHGVKFSDCKFGELPTASEHSFYGSRHG